MGTVPCEDDDCCLGVVVEVVVIVFDGVLPLFCLTAAPPVVVVAAEDFEEEEFEVGVLVAEVAGVLLPFFVFFLVFGALLFFCSNCFPCSSFSSFLLLLGPLFEGEQQQQ